jgi:hypothetical protein
MNHTFGKSGAPGAALAEVGQHPARMHRVALQALNFSKIRTDFRAKMSERELYLPTGLSRQAKAPFSHSTQPSGNLQLRLVQTNNNSLNNSIEVLDELEVCLKAGAALDHTVSHAGKSFASQSPLYKTVGSTEQPAAAEKHTKDPNGKPVVTSTSQMNEKERQRLAEKLTGAPRLIRYDTDWDDDEYVK